MSSPLNTPLGAGVFSFPCGLFVSWCRCFQFAMVETLLTAVYDQWPSLRRRKTAVVGVSSLLGFLLSVR